MAEMTGQDSDEFLSKLYAKGKEQRDREKSYGLLEGLPEGSSRNAAGQSSKKGANTVDFQLVPTLDGLDKESHTAKPSKTTKKTWSELDKYIELLLDSK
jgi:hypothetical protein